MGRQTPLAVLLAFTTLGAAQSPRGVTGVGTLLVHEWGTFTSIAVPCRPTARRLRISPVLLQGSGVRWHSSRASAISGQPKETRL